MIKRRLKRGINEMTEIYESLIMLPLVHLIILKLDVSMIFNEQK